MLAVVLLDLEEQRLEALPAHPISDSELVIFKAVPAEALEALLALVQQVEIPTDTLEEAVVVAAEYRPVIRFKLEEAAAEILQMTQHEASLELLMALPAQTGATISTSFTPEVVVQEVPRPCSQTPELEEMEAQQLAVEVAVAAVAEPQ